MRILNIVSSNVVTDPRVTKQLATISAVTDDYLAIGKKNHLLTKKSLKNYPYKFKLFGKTEENENIIKKIGRRILFGVNIIKEIHTFKPDIIHANDFDVLFIVSLSGYKNARIVFDAHEIYAKNNFINSIPVLSFVVEKLEKKFIENVDSFITVSNAAREYYIKRGYSKEPIVITNVPIKNENVMNVNKSEKFEVVYQGQIVDNRGYEEFLNAGKYIIDNDIDLVIRGFGPLKEQLIEEKEESKIERVRFDDPVEMDELISKLTESNVGVVLTKGVSANYEYTVSNKLFECIHAGLPLILSPVKEHKLLNDKYNFAIIVDRVTPENIAEAIYMLYQDKDLYDILKKNAIRAAKELTWEKESEKLETIYMDKKLVYKSDSSN